jgi:P4 family phage/plasmid primase-like protien
MNNGTNFLAAHGKTLVQAGYNILPIISRSKKPAIEEGWSKIESTPELVDQWVKGGPKGIGVLGKYTPAIDLDILDEELCKVMVEKVQEVCEVAAIRTGRAPKVLIPFRTSKPFKRKASAEFKCPAGKKQQVEILGDGQQFIAYGIHELTGDPYQWDIDLMDIPHSDLPELSEGQALEIIKFFEEQCEALGWERKGKTSENRAACSLTRDTSPLNLTDEQVESYLRDVPIEGEDYDQWRNGLFAIHHETGGSAAGLKLVLAWSSRSEKHDEAETIRTWNSISGRCENPITFRYLVALARPVRIARLRGEIDLLSRESNLEEVEAIITRMVELKLSRLEGEELLKKISEKAKRSILVLRETYKEARSEAEPTGDIGMDVAVQTLAQYYADGKHLIRSTDKSFWHYTGTHWGRVTDEQVKNKVISVVEDIAPNESYALVVERALSLLRGMQARDGDPLGLTKVAKSIVNTQTGELWIEGDGNVELRGHRPDSFLIHCLDVEYDPTATCPIFDETLLGIFAQTKVEPGEQAATAVDMARHFEEFMGYMIQANRDIPSFWLLRGDGDNGKTMLLKILIELMGPSTVFSGDISKIEQGRFGVGSLVGKLMLYDDDVTTGTRLPDGFLKQVSENKLMSGELKGINFFEFICTAVPVLACNNYPHVADLSPGFKRRTFIVPFDRTFKGGVDKDPTLLGKIIKNELSGVLNRLLEGLKRLRKRGAFLEPQPCILEKEIFSARANPLEEFIQTECWQDKNDGSCKQKIKEFYEGFKHWCDDSGIRKYPARKTVQNNLENLGYRFVKTGGYPTVKGLQYGVAPVKKANPKANPKANKVVTIKPEKLVSARQSGGPAY